MNEEPKSDTAVDLIGGSVTLVGLGCAAAPFPIAFAAPCPMWQRAIVLLAFAAVCVLASIAIDRHPGRGGARDCFTFAAMLSVVLAVVLLLIAAAVALLA